MDLEKDELNKPILCSKCGGHMKFQGLGEYRCEDCDTSAYDDYGKVRNYLEKHRGATTYEIEQGTGVRQRSIRNLVRNERIEVSEHSKIFLKCKMCGKDIRMGELCLSCQKKKEEQKNREEKANRKSTMSGYGRIQGEEGRKRFHREK
jgi:hypothetical protein